MALEQARELAQTTQNNVEELEKEKERNAQLQSQYQQKADKLRELYEAF